MHENYLRFGHMKFKRRVLFFFKKRIFIVFLFFFENLVYLILKICFVYNFTISNVKYKMVKMV